MNRHPITSNHKQKGAVVLVITFLIMLAMTIGSFAMVQSTSLESRMSANDQRSRQAMQAAQAGIDFVLDNLAVVEVDRDFLCSPAEHAVFGFQLNFTGPEPDPVNTNNMILIFDNAVQQAACENLPFEIITKTSIWSRGYSDDFESVRTLVSTIDMTTPWEFNYTTKTISAGGSPAPVVAKGNVHFQGTPEAALCETMQDCIALATPGNQTGTIDGTLVLAGGSVTAQGSVPMGEENYDSNNASLNTMSNDDLFSQFAGSGLTKDQFKNSANTLIYEPSKKDLPSTNLNQIWVDGDLTLRNGTIGSPDKPVIIVVNGDLNLAGNVIIWGVVYSENADFSAGTNKIMGSLITENNVEMKGNAAVYYNPDLRPEPESFDPDAAQAGYSEARIGSVRIGSWREIVN